MGDWDVVSSEPASSDEWAIVSQTPAFKGRPGVRAALQALVAKDAAFTKHRTRFGGTPQGAKDEDTAGERYLNSVSLGGFRQLEGALGAGVTALQRAVPGGAEPNYTARDMYDAVRLLNTARQENFAARKPRAAVGLDIMGALQMPGAKQLGAFVVGKTAPALAAAGKSIPFATRAAQTARVAGVGGALTGVTAGALARPGEELSEAGRGAATGAVLAPVLGKAVEVAPGMARATGRLAARAVGRGPSAEITSVEKLQKALRQAGVVPDAIQAASDRWTAMGGVDPALIDLVKEAGGSSEVLRLLSRSAAKAPVRRLAEDYANATVGGTQQAALEQAAKLPTGGETRTPSQIRADLATEGAKIDEHLADAQQEPPPPPRKPETGAAVFADELNRHHDVSETAYKRAYADAEAANPEAAVVEDSEVRPIFEGLKVPKTFDDELPGVAAVKRYVAKKKGAIAPGDAADWPEGESMENAAPLTMLDVQNMRQVLTHYADKYADEPGGALAARLKANLDKQVDRLVAENKITGDPAVVDKWKTAISGAREHFAKFGEGLPAKLTARKPNGEREIPSHLAADTIFSGSLNKSLNELGGSLDLVSPEALRALQEELYGRVKPADLPKLRETTGGKRLLPQDLTDAALAVPPANEAAEAVAAARREPLAARESALALGEGALKTPSEAFQPAMEGVAPTDEPIAAAGAKQAVLDTLERPPPNETGILNRLGSEQASKNLGRALDPASVARMQARMRAIQDQGRNAQQLQGATDISALANTPLLETVTPGDIAYPTRGSADFGLKIWRIVQGLHGAEYESALKLLTSKDHATKGRLLKGLLKKYPGASKAIAPFLVRPAAQQGDESAVDTLQEDYGVTP